MTHSAAKRRALLAADSAMTAIVCHGPEDYRVEHSRARSRARANSSSASAPAASARATANAGRARRCSGAATSPWVKAPVDPGHEFFGYVEELGEGAAEHFGVELGDRVIAEQIVPCERCRYCRSGQYWMCEVHNIFGFQREVADGGMAEFMRFPPTALVHKIPTSMSLGGRGDHRAARLRDPRRQPRRHPARRRRRDRRRRADRPDDGAGRAAEDAEASSSSSTWCRSGSSSRRRYGADVVINPSDEDAPAIVRGADRRLRLRRLYRGHRLPERRGAGARPDPQARPLRRVLRLRRRHDRRLVDHRRPQGARRPRRASRPLLLSDRDRPACARPGHVEGIVTHGYPLERMG